jgi:hypothetical protein
MIGTECFSYPFEWYHSHDMPADAGSLCNKVALLWESKGHCFGTGRVLDEDRSFQVSCQM